ncbi:MAG TPA: Xaa-Pro peptidase family protein [Anaerolineae bacterium]|nr:Xaa-Pro peptidase family protein [Anaerolineae bacterium]
MWAKFSPAEMARRWALARGLMRQHDLAGLLVFGNSGVNRHNQANIFWLTNHLDLHHNYLVAPLDDSIEPALYTGLTNHVPNARQVSDMPIIEWGGYDPAETVARRLQAIGLTTGRLGLVGVNHKFGMGMPYQHYLHLGHALPNLELVEVTLEFTRLRTIKSDEEVSWLRRAAEFTDRTIYALQEKIRPGLTDYSLLAIIEASYRADGGQPHIAFLRSMAMEDPNGCLPAQNPSDRVIQRGDVVITEISASYWGYSGQIHRPIFVGAEPTPTWQRMFETALVAYKRMAETIRPGATERDVIRAAAVIGEQGYEIYDDLIHGYGVDIHPPLIDRSCCQYWPWREDHQPPEGRRFEKNMAIVIQPNPITPDERMGLQLGALTVVTEHGAECLHQVPFEPIVVKL